VSAGDITLKLQSHETTRNGKPVRLTPLEFRILYALVANRGRVIPYSRLVDLAWGEDGGDAERLRSHVCRIRQKLAMPAEATPAIKVVRGVGYRFELTA
jgi:DNA-binding response OmpR family regulator